MVISALQSADGTVMDLDALRVAAGETGALVPLDVSEAAAWLPLRLDWAAAGTAWRCVDGGPPRWA